MISSICGKIRLSHVVVTQVGGYREVPAEEFAKLFRENGCTDVRVSERTEEAFPLALTLKGDDGMLFCVGSLYLVGEVKDVIRRKNMIDYEEELKKFEPCLDVADAEGAIYDRELTDILDILQEMLREAKSNRRVR